MQKVRAVFMIPKEFESWFDNFLTNNLKDEVVKSGRVALNLAKITAYEAYLKGQSRETVKVVVSERLWPYRKCPACKCYFGLDGYTLKIGSGSSRPAFCPGCGDPLDWSE